MPVVKLTQDFITNHLQCPEGKSRIEFCCEEVSGFYCEVRITSPGQATWYLRYKNGAGKTCHSKLGRTTEIDLMTARKKARTLKAEIQLGADPQASERARLAVITYSDYFEHHYLPYATTRKRSWKRDEELYRLRIKAVLGDKRLNEIDRKSIVQFHSALKAEGLAGATCDHHIKLLKRSFNLAIDWELMTTNPARRVELFNEDNKVDHYLNDEELGRLLTVLRTDENRPVCLIMLFLLSTGCRLNEALSAKWSDIDMDQQKTFCIRSANSKSKRMRSVPLNETAISVLNQLGTKDKFEDVFVNHTTGEAYVAVHKVWNRLRNAALMPHFRIHDLRHTWASFLINSGRTLYEVAKLLGHADGSLACTARYSHLSTKSLQDAANSASIIIKGAMEVPQVPV